MGSSMPLWRWPRRRLRCGRLGGDHGREHRHVLLPQSRRLPALGMDLPRVQFVPPREVGRAHARTERPATGAAFSSSQ
jgi:hypothetical protein